MKTPEVFVVDFQVLVKSDEPRADLATVQAMVERIEASLKECGGDYIVREVRWG